ncbi:hypothetical protein HS088_TW06G01183 [Tripterygium wilfordii]|uniref:Remorin C-terminal domain-containing protein n=1 Tax=Tripterygium wilfordii TaxID=458696 RepID=A0A7J7DLP3_TRIWF|nr:uncharacterized protein LOC120000364 [Tripterygium wilfordii]KAF5747006.1 hypothetical protein HS088_TW06G01183 [Tripterygium wilfordii]
MPELGFDDNSSGRSSASRARDASPDSVIFTLDSNFFSSASASVDRDSFASEISLHLAAHDVDQHESSSGPDPDPQKAIHSRLSRKGDKAKVRKENNNETAAVEDNNIDLDSARNSFSIALKECQERRSRSEAHLKKLDRRRPASLDLNNVTASSPRLGGMKKSSISSHKSGTFPSPGTPNYRHAGVGMQKGWSSERVPLHTNGNRRQVGAAMLPLNNGRTLPSKWEDAERWIFSPVSGDSVVRQPLQATQRRPKSKSGPLGAPGVAYYSMYSPAMPLFEGGNAGNFVADSPFSAGVITADGLAIHSGSHGVAFPMCTEPCIGRSISMHGCSEMLAQQSFHSQVKSTEERLDGVMNAATDISRVASSRDMATQMSPESSTNSSPKRRSSFSTSTPSALQIVEAQSVHSSKSEVRDVQVDERVTVTRWSKKQRPRILGKGSEMTDDWRKKDMVTRSSSWNITETAKSISKVKREEAKITAWENLQKAKAEAAIRKLEMKLEKKRSSSMDKIMTKLRAAQKKAQEMRSSILANQGHQVTRSSQKAVSFRRTRPISSLSGCFTCHAF